MKNVNNFEKFLRKRLEIKIKALPLHPQSGNNNDAESDKMVLRNIFEKKVIKKFGDFKNMLYLCTAFPP